MSYVQSAGKSLAVGAALVLTVIALAVAGTAIPAHAQVHETILYDFPGGTSEPGSPSGLVAQGRDGNLYGYSQTGGTSNAGTIFQMSSSGGSPNVLYNFSTRDECDLGLTLGTDGNFYGACQVGGTYTYGYVFQFTPPPSVVFSVLYTFCPPPSCSDGANPSSRPIEGRDGNFYLTTISGGNDNCTNGCGTVFKLIPPEEQGGVWTPSVLYSFTDDPNLSYPYGPLFLGSNGNLYGTTQGGISDPGVSDPVCPPNCGAVYEITTAGNLTPLHIFGGSPSDGATPTRGVIQSREGLVYGTTIQGGEDNFGTIFRMTGTGDTTLVPLPPFDYSFSSWANGIPRGMVQASNGNFYITGSGCGDGPPACNDYGSIFEITPEGTFSIAYPFGGPPNDGASPESTLSHTSGILYGVTEKGGNVDNDGTLYSLNFEAPQFCRPQILAGGQLSPTEILGQGFSGEQGSSSVVAFGGVQATSITVTGTTFITATIPAGAKTGLVTVTTGSTTLSSLQTFYVLPAIISFMPPSGAVGTPVTIAGTGLAQTTKVSFGSVTAKFTVNSDVQVTAIVPTGAVTAPIYITTAGGTAVSASEFTVTH